MNGSIDVIIGATPEMIHNWGWLLAFGVVLIVLGVVAVVRSATATIVSMVFFGWLLVLASTIQFVEAFMVGHWAGFFLHLLIAIPVKVRLGIQRQAPIQPLRLETHHVRVERFRS